MLRKEHMSHVRRVAVRMSTLSNLRPIHLTDLKNLFSWMISSIPTAVASNNHNSRWNICKKNCHRPFFTIIPEPVYRMTSHFWLSLREKSFWNRFILTRVIVDTDFFCIFGIYSDGPMEMLHWPAKVISPFKKYFVQVWKIH